MHVEFICKWLFKDGFWTLLKLFSPRKLCEWIPTIISTLLSYCSRSHFMSNYTYPWDDSPFNQDQAFRWNLSHCCKGNIILIHQAHFMPSILQCLRNTFIFSPIWSNNQGWMCNCNPWHQIHLEPSPQLGCFLIEHGKSL